MDSKKIWDDDISEIINIVNNKYNNEDCITANKLQKMDILAIIANIVLQDRANVKNANK